MWHLTPEYHGGQYRASTKFGYKQMQGWKVINPNRVLQVNFHIWPHLTFDLLMWPLTPEYHGGQHRASTNQVWLQTDAGLEIYQPLYSLAGKTFTFDLIWPLTYFSDLWPQNIMEANIGHLPTKFGYKQMQGWKVINRYRVLQVSLHIWPHLTFDLLMWPLTPEFNGGQYRASTNQVWL